MTRKKLFSLYVLPLFFTLLFLGCTKGDRKEAQGTDKEATETEQGILAPIKALDTKTKSLFDDIRLPENMIPVNGFEFSTLGGDFSQKILLVKNSKEEEDFFELLFLNFYDALETYRLDNRYTFEGTPTDVVVRQLEVTGDSILDIIVTNTNDKKSELRILSGPMILENSTTDDLPPYTELLSLVTDNSPLIHPERDPFEIEVVIVAKDGISYQSEIYLYNSETQKFFLAREETNSIEEPNFQRLDNFPTLERDQINLFLEKGLWLSKTSPKNSLFFDFREDILYLDSSDFMTPYSIRSLSPIGSYRFYLLLRSTFLSNLYQEVTFEVKGENEIEVSIPFDEAWSGLYQLEERER